jgi:superfamily II DNA or RNA helicase
MVLLPRIYDNIEQKLLPALCDALEPATHADFCVGYFNLRGWKQLDSYIERWDGGEGKRCRLLVGMQKLPQEEQREMYSLIRADGGLDNSTALRLKKKLADEFRQQLATGVPTNEDEEGLRRLAAQIRAGKVIVKLFLRHSLHAKLYLLYRPDPINPIIGYLGSSNLTASGLSHGGELNVDVLDDDATRKLNRWFEDRWNDRWCLDISQELVEIIEESWAREELTPPYHVYVKMAYHLSQEARAGLAEFRIPRDFGNRLFAFQTAAVKIAAHHLNKRGGVLIGDVVGLGKTLMATALARIFEDDYGIETLIICPKNLVPMWEDYRQRYRLRAKVLSLTRVTKELAEMRRFRLVLIDESHNLRNREGRRYRAIKEYIEKNDSRCILLSATPYNKTYHDLSSQLRLFVAEDKDLGIRPERLLRELGDAAFAALGQVAPRTIAAFEKSEYADDWRELMRLYMVRRTRTFIQENYAKADEATGRKFLVLEDGTPSYFPSRVPKTVKFRVDGDDPQDQYARLYTPPVVDAVNNLNLPRYGLGNYVAVRPRVKPTAGEEKVLRDLSRAGKRLMGFCRTNLFKRLESSGQAFLLSIERHILRNYIFLHAINNNLPLPIGTQDATLLDARVMDEDADSTSLTASLIDYEDGADADKAEEVAEPEDVSSLHNAKDFERRAASTYAQYADQNFSHFKWLAPTLFTSELKRDLEEDCQALLSILHLSGEWRAAEDRKLDALATLINRKYKTEKLLVFSQFADTVRYIARELRRRGIKQIAGVTGASENPTEIAWRFSPVSNEKQTRVPSEEEELRVLVATDVLSEGQNLQDAHVVVNYDLPWAIIRLIQRAGRVDRVGQKADSILCYSFLPAEGVESIIRLRARVRERLRQNAEVVGTDEAFFEDDKRDGFLLDLYNEKSNVLDGEADTEVDLASYAYQIWKNAITENPKLQKIIPELPPVTYATKQHIPFGKDAPEGALVYMRTAEGNDALAWIDERGNSVTESQYAILKAAECVPETKPLPRAENQHELVQKGVELIIREEKNVGGGLGRPSGARFRIYNRLKSYADSVRGTLFESEALLKTIDEIYRYPLRQATADVLNRQMRGGATDESLVQLVIALRDEDRLCVVHEDEQDGEPRIICSMGLRDSQA